MMKRVVLLLSVCFCVAWVSGVWAAKEDCGDPPNAPGVPAAEVNEEDLNVKNDYDTVVEEDTRPGVTYLTFVNGDAPNPNACGLNSTGGTLTGWGGPIDGDNVTIGEGAGSRNEIVIGGVLFQRGLGTHGPATIIYDISGGQWTKFSAQVGMSDEKDPADCGAGGTSEFVFSLDGDEVFGSETLAGSTDGENTPPLLVEFDIPAGTQELLITITDGGDGNGCDHSALGDAKLMTNATFAVDVTDKLATSWGLVKQGY